ncbi:hypothetical protein SAMN05216191_101540 [Paenibacillus jilunlii]|uniref:Uncharacterized protein n=1 Tax=Paenibacillus jilunlii TaxID=682956 RepID=A0A1G9GRV1_9BACL|nr:hypothetical protein AML91_16695 [Paenibacillus jilunlii]SDL03397.1 hypothetical protein SAMN05216191_101540 [Paenibacillus jilunlii]
MLDDTPRKLLRIISQFHYHFRRLPTLPELRRLSGRRPAEIIKGFKVLAAENYIEWSVSEPIQKADILEAWERNIPYDTTLQQGPQSARRNTNIDYWLYH